jgi:hypothetical protein
VSNENASPDRQWEKLRALSDELESSYWGPLLHTPFATLEKMAAAAKKDVPVLHGALEAFRTNLLAVKELLELPYMLVAPLIPEVMEKARQLQSNGGLVDDFPSHEQEAEAVDMVVSALARSKEQFTGRAELQRLLHQACLLSWGAFETYCKTVFIAAVNQKPSLYAVLLKSQNLKERFGLPQSSWPSILESHNYDLNGKLGTIVAADKDFSSPQLLKDLFPTLFAGLPGEHKKFMELFASDQFWNLGQRRHLIAHRCAIVDAEYQKRTGDLSQPVGELLRLRGRDVGEALGTVAKLAIGLYARARYCWYRPEQISSALGSTKRPDSLPEA